MQDIEEIIIPKEVEIAVNRVLTIKGPKGELQREFVYPNIKIVKEDDKIIIKAEKVTKRERKIIGTIKAHIRNMIKGVQEGFTYKLQICSVHFPMTVTIDKDKKEIVIKNFLGESKSRKSKILQNVDVKIEKEIITIESADKEAAGQTAANIENITRIRKKDRRIFQDGIWIIEKADKKLLE